MCSTDVDEALMKEEFDKLSAALIQGASTCSPPLPLTTIVVQVMFCQLQCYDFCAFFPFLCFMQSGRIFFNFFLHSLFLPVKHSVCYPVKGRIFLISYFVVVV